MSEIKYTPGRLYFEIDGTRFTTKGYCGGACVQAQERESKRIHELIQRIVDTYDSADRIAELEQALRESTELLHTILVSNATSGWRCLRGRIADNERLLGGNNNG